MEMEEFVLCDVNGGGCSKLKAYFLSLERVILLPGSELLKTWRDCDRPKAELLERSGRVR